MNSDILNEVIDYREYNASDYESYAKFCEENFGKKNYQLNRSYLDWLYKDTDRSFTVAISGGEVIGIIHNFKAPIAFNDGYKLVTVLHDLMVDNKHRAGAGFHLMQKGLYSDDYVVLPGSVGRLSRAYGRLGSKSFNSFWYKKFQMPRGFFSLRKVKNLLKYKELAKKQGLLFGNSIESKDEFIESALNKFCDIESYVNYFKWRFFDKSAPLTFYVADENKKNSALFVIGKRGRLPYVRIFYVNTQSEIVLSDILKFISKIAGKIGVPVLLYTSFESAPPSSLNYKSYAEIPISYIYSKKKDYDFSTEVPSFCSDIGFDGVNPYETV